jgi:hypothetical protein
MAAAWKVGCPFIAKSTAVVLITAHENGWLKDAHWPEMTPRITTATITSRFRGTPIPRTHFTEGNWRLLENKPDMEPIQPLDSPVDKEPISPSKEEGEEILSPSQGEEILSPSQGGYNLSPECVITRVTNIKDPILSVDLL